MNAAALPYVLTLGFFYGSTLVASRFSVGQYNPTTYIGLRLILASIAHLAVYAVQAGRRLPRDRQLWGRAAVLGVLGTALPMTGIVSSLQFQSSGVTSTLVTTGPALTVLLAHFTLKDERLTARKGLGVGLALSGALLLAVLGESGLPDVGRANPIGYAMVLLAMVAASAGTIYARKRLRTYDSFDVASIRMFFAAATVMPLSAILFGVDLSGVDARGYAALAYAAAVGTFAAQFLVFYVIQRFGATASALAGYVIPVFAGLGGALLLDERITPGMLAGMALIALGITLLNERPAVRQLPIS